MRKNTIFNLSLNLYLIAIFCFFFAPPVSAAPLQSPEINMVNVEFASGTDYICTEFNNGGACWKLHIEGSDFAITTEGIIDDDWELFIGCKPKIVKSSCKLNVHGDLNSSMRPSTIDCLIDTVPIGPCEVSVSTSKSSTTFVCNFKPTPSTFNVKIIEGRRWQCTQD